MIEEALSAFLRRWRDEGIEEMLVQTSGSTGAPKEMRVRKAHMRASAEATLKFLGLEPGHRALLCLPLQYIAGQMMVVRAEVGQLDLLVVEPSSRPLAGLTYAPDFVAMTPMQVYESLQHVHDANLLREVRHLIIGGGAVPEALEEQLADFPHAVWSTYGMTETLSHVAMRRLNGVGRSAYYTPLPEVSVCVDVERGTLTVHAPRVCPEVLYTNDVGEVDEAGCFVVLGRVDNIVCSGGIKLQIEVLEEQLRAVFTAPFALTSVPDVRLGQMLVLLYTEEVSEGEILERCAALLGTIASPKRAWRVDEVPTTATDKPSRAAIRALAEQLAQT